MKSKFSVSRSRISPRGFRSQPWLAVGALGLGLIGAAPFRSLGMLAPEPDSYLLLSADRSQTLVMARSVRSRRWGDDAGRWQNLPDGRKVDLYTQFPSNGVYRLPDLTPIYFLDWFDDSNSFACSPNLEAIAKFNPYAVHGNPTNAAAPKPKAIRFTRHGVEVGSYTAAELVDNPVIGTIPFGQYRLEWLDSFRLTSPDRLEVTTVRRGLFCYGRELVVCRGNRLVFDLDSGALLSADRPLARLAKALLILVLIGVLAGIAVLRLRRRPHVPGDA